MATAVTERSSSSPSTLVPSTLVPSTLVPSTLVRAIAFAILTLMAAAPLWGQKPPLDHSVYGKWPQVDRPRISNDGAYVTYLVTGLPTRSRLIVQATQRAWRLELDGASDAELTQDSQTLVFKARGDTLGILRLGDSRPRYVAGVQSYRLPKGGTGEWVAYQLTTPANELVVHNLHTGAERRYSGVREYAWSRDGGALALVQDVAVAGGGTADASSSQTVVWVSPADGRTRTIWHGNTARQVVFDATGSQLAFLAASQREGPAGTAVWYYRAGARQAVEQVSDRTAGVGPDLRVGDGAPRFGTAGSRLFVTLVPASPSAAPRPELARVDVWHYRDPRLQSKQLHELARPRSYEAVIAVGGERVIRLAGEHDQVVSNPEGVEEHVVVKARVGDWSERGWFPPARTALYLVSTRDGARSLVKKAGIAGWGGTLSPTGRYVVYYDETVRHHFAYDTRTGATVNVTQQIPVPVYDEGHDLPEPPPPYTYDVTWLPTDTAFIVYGRYDVWQVDPRGVRPPVNLTNGLGRRQGITFRLTWAENPWQAVWGPKRDRLLLTAFDWRTKENGFYSKQVGAPGDPVRLTMGPYLYHVPSPASSAWINERFAPLKARDAEVYVVRRMSATESPNYFWTRDFKTYQPLSALAPEQAYNWLTAELVRWKALDGRWAEGILYKPENFDSTKQYPVILHFYERLANRLNEYPVPEAVAGQLRIPYFVSNGYLVFMPDIHYRLGEPGASVYDYVISAARHLSQLPYVDAHHVGLQGHSFGGYEVNYLVTRTRMFAAAASAAGPTDLVSGYGGLADAGHSLQYLYETFQTRIGGTLWEHPDRYLKNSPLFRADSIQTPLLIMHNKRDGAVPWSQGVELFTALRRLGKRAWMLQYDDGDHQLGGKSAEDYTIRLAQFFDHYLKGAPPPKWMTQGIPAKLKGIDDGLALDYDTPTPGPGLVADDADHATSVVPVVPAHTGLR